MALRKIIFASIFASTPLPAIGQNLEAGDILNLGNQLLRGLQQPQTTSPQQAPATPQVRTETHTAPAYSRSEVSETQALLVQLGYDPGVVDGVMGNRTSNAIRQFQAAQGLPQTGQPSPGLLVRLQSFAGTSGTANTGIVEFVSGDQAITPSFDCGRATTAIELAICSSAELAALDKRMDAIYRNALQTSQDRNGLVADQRAWLDIRNRCNANAVCIRSALVHRIDDLGKLAASDGRAVPSPSSVVPALELETPRMDGSATAVALVAPANIVGRANLATTVCLEPSVAESVRPLAEAAVGKSLTISNMNARVRDATHMLVVYDDMYFLVGGDCIEQMRYAIERDYSGAYNGVSFTQLVAAQAENTTLPTNVAVPAADLNISTERLPLTRLYLSQYLNQVPRETRIEKFKKYIGHLGAHPTETPVLSRDEVNGRNPEFVANSAIGRWDDALQSLSLAPPVSVVASVDLSRGNYDFARGVMTFPNAPGSEVDGKRYLSDGSGLFAPLPDSQKQQVARTEDLLLWFLQDQITPGFMRITLDRMVPMPEIAMTAESAEQFILSETRTIAELRYSVDEVSPLTESGVLGFDGTLIGARVFTDTGDELIAWTPDQLPPVAVAMPAPEPEAPAPAPLEVVDVDNLSILGIRLGASREAALELIARSDEIVYQIGFTASQPEAVDENAEAIALANGEWFALHYDRATDPRKVIGLIRRIRVDPSIPMVAVQEAMTSAYGPPTWQETSGGSWTEWHWRTDGSDAPCRLIGWQDGTMFPGARAGERGDIKRVPMGLGRSGGNNRSFIHVADLVTFIDANFKDSDWNQAELSTCPAALDATFMESMTAEHTILMILVDPIAFNAANEAASATQPAASFDIKLK